MVAAIVLTALANVVLYGGVFVETEARGNDAPVPATPSGTRETSPAEQALIAERDASAALPGQFVPTQGRSHVRRIGQTVDFCPVAQVRADCYASNPPTSGLHRGVERAADVGGGRRMDIPPSPGLYDGPVPREAISHILEHAGVFVGYRCDTPQCEQAAGALGVLVLDALGRGKRVVLAPDPDLAPNTIALVAWTRHDVMNAADYEDARARAFIDAHSCRFDPEGFCS